MITTSSANTDLRWFLAQARPRRLRSIREFAESEIVLPDGPFAGRRFRCERQPYTGLWLDQIDSGLWRRFVATGPTQSGKTLACFVIPLLYHLFEIGETVKQPACFLWQANGESKAEQLAMPPPLWKVHRKRWPGSHDLADVDLQGRNSRVFGGYTLERRFRYRSAAGGRFQNGNSEMSPVSIGEMLDLK